MIRRFEDKVALITGGTSGIGLATAKRLLDEGATVIVTGRSPDGIKNAETVLEGRAQVVKSDAADPGQVQDLIASVVHEHGRLDALFLNAGVALPGPLLESEPESYERMLDINLKGPWHAIRAAAPHLKDGASIVVNTSVANVKGIPGFGAYASTKAGLRSLVRTGASELSAQGVRINAVSPGPIETPLFGKTGMTTQQQDEFKSGIAGQLPLGRLGRAEEVAAATAFLLSDDASFIQGTELAVDGGLTQV